MSRLNARLNYLANLQPGWLDGQGEVISPAVLGTAKEIMAGLFPADSTVLFTTPGLFPMEDGGMCIEWASPTRILSVELHPDGEIELYYLNAETRRDCEVLTRDTGEALLKVKETLAVAGCFHAEETVPA